MVLTQKLQEKAKEVEAPACGRASPASALRPWHARSFLDSAVQRLSIALQRAIQGDQIRRSHVRRVRRGGVPADYYECGGGAGYRRSSSPSSSGSSVPAAAPV